MHSSISTTKSEDGGKNNKYMQGLYVICHHLNNNIPPVFYLDNKYVLPVSYFESSWATSNKSWFHRLCVEMRALDSNRKHCLDFCLDRPPLAYHPYYFSPIAFSVYSLYSTSPRALSTAPGESDRVCQRHLFPRSLSTPALYQPSLGQGTKHKQALRETYRNASD